MAEDAGALLVRSGLVSTSSFDEARARTEELGGTIGEQLVYAGALTDDQLTEFYKQRLLVPQVNPNTLARLPIGVVAAIPQDMAVELRVVPVAIDQDNNLTIAMSDPSDSNAVDEIAFFTGSYVVRAVATQMQIAWCLAHYYGHVTPLGQRLLQPSEATPVAPVSPQKPRQKGLTGQVQAMRHRGRPPVTSPVDVQRPTSDQLPRATSVASAEAAGLSAPVVTPAPMPVVSDVPAFLREDTNGVPAERAPRARSISGEIRVPKKRAESIKPNVEEDPYTDDDESGPVITVEVNDDYVPPKPVRKRPAKEDPPELAARGGEIETRSSVARSVDEGPLIIISDQLDDPKPDAVGEIKARSQRNDTAAPARSIEVSDDESEGVVIHARYEPESSPILLTKDEEPVVELAARKSQPIPREAREPKRTQIGMAVTSPRAHRDTETGGVPEMVDDSPTVQNTAATAADIDAAIDAAPDAIPDEADDADTGATRDTAPRAATDLGQLARPLHTPKWAEHEDLDDGWGPPGSTIPPPLLGAMPGSDDEDEDAVPGRIPVSDVDSAPLIVAPPSPPETSRGSPRAVSQPVRAVEDATSRMLELIRSLEHAPTRDAVVGMMVAHLAETHRRAGFFMIKPTHKNGLNELGVFSMDPRPASLPFATLRLDGPSTLQDVVGTRLPYRGPMHDNASRQFLANVLGACPPEILLVPVVVRDRVVGVLFGEHRMRHTFDDQLALASRAAGLALERVLMAKRG